MDKIEVSNVSLSMALGKIEGCAPRRSTLPILANVLMELREGELWLTATDLDVRGTVPIQVVTGSVFPALTVNVAALSKLVDGGGSHSVCLRSVDDSLVVSVPGQGIAAKLPTMPAVEFPVPLLAEGRQVAHFPAAMLDRVCHKVAPFAAADEDRPIITVVRMWTADWYARFWAADGFKASIMEATCEDGEEWDLLVPAKAFSCMERFHGPATLTVGSNKTVSFTFEDGTALSAVCIEGKYPNLDKLIPSEPLCKFKVNACDWLCGLEAVTLPDMINGKGFYHEVSSRGLDVIAAQDARAALCRVPVEAEEADLSVKFVLGKGHIETILRAAGGEVEVAMQVPVQGELATTPLLFTQDGWRALLMPMRPNTRELPTEELQFLSPELQRGYSDV